MPTTKSMRKLVPNLLDEKYSLKGTGVNTSTRKHNETRVHLSDLKLIETLFKIQGQNTLCIHVTLTNAASYPYMHTYTSRESRLDKRTDADTEYAYKSRLGGNTSTYIQLRTYTIHTHTRTYMCRCH
jgi:hypothetical protein